MMVIIVQANIGIIVAKGGCPYLRAVRIINTVQDVIKGEFDSGSVA